MDKAGSFMKGLLLGALAGVVGGVLLAPKSGKETREDLMKMVDKVKKDAVEYFEEARSMVMEKVAALKAAGKKLDEKKYFAIVGEVVSELKDDKAITLDAAKRLGSQLRRDWKKVQTAFVGSPETK
ncbi:YtxH domain-containing protein [Candidatus Dojkabacteria bacterium]|nr:YtxH domain-containing protein [Candidatus Dojkabacteria bacterium]